MPDTNASIIDELYDGIQDSSCKLDSGIEGFKFLFENWQRRRNTPEDTGCFVVYEALIERLCNISIETERLVYMAMQLECTQNITNIKEND